MKTLLSKSGFYIGDPENAVNYNLYNKIASIEGFKLIDYNDEGEDEKLLVFNSHIGNKQFQGIKNKISIMSGQLSIIPFELVSESADVRYADLYYGTHLSVETIDNQSLSLILNNEEFILKF